MALLIRYLTDSGPQVGLLVDEMIHALDDNPYMTVTLTPGRPLLRLDEARLAPPTQPSKIVAVGRNYAAHAAEHDASVPDEPMLFFKPPSALIAHGETIRIPANAGRVDEEAELAVVIKRPARHVAPEDALDYVLGYTCGNDVSARVYQKKDGQWGRAKGFDTFCPLGPWIKTDLDPLDLAIQGRVNGEVVQDSRTSDMVFDVRTLIAFISSVMTLMPGDVIMTGTPAGVTQLGEGDEVEIEIEGIGRLRNPVTMEG